ncbi:alpha/beta hydrolase family esterase [Uliginosibacterium gangwonense]|uniref:alpha/beta hydrolase family esterase n=1 Tax=Uliginosibacterium gangwonense TaxID=392736 RepID=UPI001FE15FA6|nr:prolyl oligopeptidase family serine peptidase [Uliginosibacterium gangwonense]
MSSKGCSSTTLFANGKYTLTSDGLSREFLVSVPANYNPKKAYPLVVGLHWRGGQATDVYNGNSWASQKPFYGLKELYGDSAIFVAPNGLDSGWANPNNRDIHFVQAMVDQLKNGLCLDTSRIYATGFSFGGMMSNAIGCEMGNTFRAVAPMSGSLWSGCGNSQNKVAAILLHSKVDSVVGYQYGEEARDKYIAKNSCTTTTRAIGTNGCVEYQGCNSKYPVAWCGYNDGGHWPPAFAAKEIKTFFDRF